jgi:Tfp pilus assembly protein PilW
MTPTIADQAREQGVTLLELVITMAMFTLIVSGITLVWHYTQTAYFQGAEAAELQQTTRVALEQMVREIRQAGYDPCRYSGACPSAFHPTKPGIYPIQAFSASSLWVQADRNGDGGISAGTTESESVCFYRDGSGVVRRKTTGGDCASGGDELARDVTALTFSYFKADGTAAASWDQIRLVRIGLTAQRTVDGQPLTFALRTDVLLRDR